MLNWLRYGLLMWITCGVASILSGVVQAQTPRVVLIEEFTNAFSEESAIQHQSFNSLVEGYYPDVIALRYHTNFPGADPLYQYDPLTIDERIDYYNASTIPTAFLNGRLPLFPPPFYPGAPGGYTSALLENAINQVDALTMELHYGLTSSADELLISLVIRATSPYSGNAVAQVVVADEITTYQVAPGSNGETVFPYAVRAMLPNAKGTPLPAEFKAGSSTSLMFRMPIGPGVDPSNLRVVAFVQEVNTKTVVQAVTGDPGTTNDYDVAIERVEAPVDGVCGDTVFPAVRIVNLGNETLESALVTFSANTNPPLLFRWEGSLAYLESEVVEFQGAYFENQLDNQISFVTDLPNSMTDQNAWNGRVDQSFTRAGVAEQFVDVVIATDLFGQETTWEIRDSAEQVIAGGGPYQNDMLVTYTERVPLTDFACYRFVIYDSGNDGMCCLWGLGRFQLRDAKGRIVAQGTEFGSEFSQPFYHYDALGVDRPENKLLRFDVFPNPANSQVALVRSNGFQESAQLRVWSSYGQLLIDRAWLAHDDQPQQIQVSSWAAGIYFLEVQTATDKQVRKLSVVR